MVSIPLSGLEVSIHSWSSVYRFSSTVHCQSLGNTLVYPFRISLFPLAEKARIAGLKLWFCARRRKYCCRLHLAKPCAGLWSSLAAAAPDCAIAADIVIAVVVYIPSRSLMSSNGLDMIAETVRPGDGSEMSWPESATSRWTC